MPVPIHQADTVTHPADTVEPYYAPQYLDGFPSAAPGDSALGSIDGLPVMEMPAGGDAKHFAHSPLHDTPSMALLLAGLLAVALCYHKGYKYIENFFHYMFSTRRRENLFEDHTVNETSIQAALVANTCIVEGFIIYLAVQLMWPVFALSLQQGVFLHVAAYSGLALAFYAAQWVVFKLLGYTFLDAVGSKLWIDGFKASQSFLGLTLLPVLVLLMLYPAHGKLLLTVAASLYLVARLIFIYKGFRIFYGNLSSILYFLLYLCAVEIVPLVLVTGLTYWISGILQSLISK
jgi:hypothetical protein